LEKIEKAFWMQSIVFLLITASLIIPIRGGLQTIPVNQSNVYFSNKMYANHASINYMWNFFNALTHKSDANNPYDFFDDTTAENTINKTRKQLLTKNTDSILNTTKPNVILIIWESLTAKVVGSLGGEPTVTKNLNKLSKEGILFTNFYANGDRTDKGIPAILSGYYPQPTKSIMKMPNKTRSIPMLPKEMRAIGYKTSFYYGGDLNFGNMNTYLRNAQISEIIDGSVFDKKDWNSKWGAFDDVFMNRFAKDLSKKQTEPFFKIALTSTSHEPFELNSTYKFGQDSHDNLFRSAHAYTDKVIGDFIDFAKKQDWYKKYINCYNVGSWTQVSKTQRGI
jgi:phosphoglycerol transferase MdoB-like AlkP superfamily enzyme